MQDFWNKWSWGLCVIPLLLNAYIINKLTSITQLVTHLSTTALFEKKDYEAAISDCKTAVEQAQLTLSDSSAELVEKAYGRYFEADIFYVI